MNTWLRFDCEYSLAPTEIFTILEAATSRVQNPDFEEDFSEQSDNKKHPKDSC